MKVEAMILFVFTFVAGCGTIERRYPLPPTSWYDEKVDEIRDLKMVATTVVAPGDWEQCWQWKGLYRDVYIRASDRAHDAISFWWPSLVCRPVPGDDSGVGHQECMDSIAGRIDAMGRNRTFFCRKEHKLN